jgi:hypothetical protein
MKICPPYSANHTEGGICGTYWSIVANSSYILNCKEKITFLSYKVFWPGNHWKTKNPFSNMIIQYNRDNITICKQDLSYLAFASDFTNEFQTEYVYYQDFSLTGNVLLYYCDYFNGGYQKTTCNAEGSNLICNLDQCRNK